MRNTKMRTRLCTCLICLNLVFIWGNSLMPGEVSRQISQWVASLLGSVTEQPAIETEAGQGLLRKFAHFSEFACLGMLLCWRLSMAGKHGRNLAALSLLGGVAAACIDETIQIFAVERGPGVRDVLIDTCGTAAGMILLKLGDDLLQRIKQNKNNLEETT